jgi:acylpyruvate hydrolase
VVEEDRVFDLSSAARQEPTFTSVVSLVRGGVEALRKAREIVGFGRANHALWRALEGLEHAPLVSRESRLFAVGLNYADHAAENNLPPPDLPIIFGKLASGITPHGQGIPLPPGTDQVDYEAEFAFMVGCRARRVEEAAAAICIAGYTIMNDVTARDFQIKDGQWFRGKNCDGFAPLGPWLVTADEIPQPDNLEITLTLNGHIRQHSNTKDQFFKPAALIAFLSQTLTLEPGDIISTGTPSGIGFHAKPQVFLRSGDIVEIAIEQIGVLRNSVFRPGE